MPTMTYGEAALPIFRRELGVKEDPPGSNDGPRVRVYREGNPPEPWCADFGTWGLKQAGFPQPTWNKAYCPAWASAAAQGVGGMRVLGQSEVPRPGDVALYDWGNDGVEDHWGIVESVQSFNSFTAIEGNTAVGNDSNGGEVMRRQRSRASVGMFIRLPAVPAKAEFYFEEMPWDQGGLGPVIIGNKKGYTPLRAKAVAAAFRLRGHKTSTVASEDGGVYVLSWAPGTYGNAFRFGPWVDEAARDAKRLGRAKNTGRVMRAFRGRERSLYPWPK